jgi:hypothetical protein
MKHDPGLDAVIKAKHLNVRKACRVRGRGKRVYCNCRFLVNMDGHEERCSAGNNIPSSPPDVKMNEASIPAGKDKHHDYEQYLRGGHDEVADEQEGMIFTKYGLPHVMVPTITIPEGMIANLSLCQQVTGEVQGG